MCAAAVIERHDATIGGRHDVRADCEHLAKCPAHRHEESAGEAGERRTLRHRRVWTRIARVPAVCCVVASDLGEHSGATKPKLPGTWRQRGQRTDAIEAVFIGEPGHEPRVLGAGREDVADTEVTRLHALAPRDPRRGDESVRAWQQHDIADSRRLYAGGASQCDGPAPASVAGARAIEQMGGESFALHGDLKVLTHSVGAHLGGNCIVSEFDGGGKRLIEG